MTQTSPIMGNNPTDYDDDFYEYYSDHPLGSDGPLIDQLIDVYGAQEIINLCQKHINEQRQTLEFTITKPSTQTIDDAVLFQEF